MVMDDRKENHGFEYEMFKQKKSELYYPELDIRPQVLTEICMSVKKHSIFHLYINYAGTRVF